MGIRVPVELDPSGVVAGGRTVNRTLADVDRAASRTETSVGGVTRKLVVMGVRTAGTALTVAALISQLKKSITIQRDFEKSMADLSAITGSTGVELQFLNEEAKKLGSTTNFSASQVATSFKLIASAKPDLLESSEALASVTKNVLLLAEASGTTLEDAASTVGSALNQFGADADEAARFVNVLAAGSKLGASEVEATAGALKNAGIAANSAGLSFEEFNATVQVLATAGLKGSEAGTSLRTIFSKLETDVDKNVRPSIVGLSTALTNLAAKELDTTGLVKMFGEEHKDAARFVLDNRNEVDRLTTALTGTNVATEQASIKMNTLDGDMLSLNSAVEGLYINIGTLLNPTVRDAAQWFTVAANNAAFFFDTFTEGTKAALLAEMASLRDEIKDVNAELINSETVWGRLKNVATFDATTTDKATKDLKALQLQLAEVERQYTFLTKPTAFNNVAGVGPEGPVQPSGIIRPSIIPDTGVTDESVKNAERDLQLLTGLQQQLTAVTADTSRETSQLTAAFRLSENATDSQIDKAKQLAGALFDQAEKAKNAAKEKRTADQLAADVSGISFGLLSPGDQLRAEEQEKLDVLNEYALLGAEQAKQAEELKTTITKQAADDRKALQRTEQMNLLASSAQGFDALSQLAGAFAGEQDNRNRTAFALSKAFAIASAGVNLSLAISQALADPTALTLPQKLDNYAVIGTAGAGLVNSITSANYATGGFVQGAGSGTSDSINANISSGEFVMNARATSRNRGVLESLNNGGGVSGGGNSVNINVINNAPAEVTTQTASNGDITIQIDERINKLTPGIIGDELANPYSKGNRSIRSGYSVPRK